MHSPVNIHEFLVSLPRRVKQALMMALDALVFPLLIMAALALRLDLSRAVPVDLWLLPAASLLMVPLLWAMGVYHRMVRQLGGEVLKGMTVSVALSATALAALAYMVPAQFAPRSIFIIFALLAIAWLAGSRYLVHRWLTRALGDRLDREPVAIFGAGEAGIQAATALMSSSEYRPMLFVDDNRKLHGTLIRGLKVVSREQLAPMLERGDIATVLLALPSASRRTRMEVVQFLESFPVAVKSVPALPDIIAGRARVEALRDVAIEDLLGRDTVAPQADLLSRNLTGLNVLVTGAGGSIGSELCRQIASQKPARLVLMDVSEFALYSIERELEPLCREQGIELVYRLGSVLDQHLMLSCLRDQAIHTVFHAAAYKHVPLVENNECAGCANNVFGTLTVARCAIDAGVERVVLVSTDKAVRPTNVMGASKRLAEMVLQALASTVTRPVFTMVRFGNVLGSSGSVVPLFRKQISEGGPVTVTHPEVTRYFMTIPEAAQLVIQAGAMARGGEVFLLDMGEPVRIIDLARTLIHLMGQTIRDAEHPDGDIEIRFTGLRPGEKLYEELLIGEDSVGTDHPGILQATEESLDWPAMEAVLEQLHQAIQAGDAGAVRQLLSEHVHGYQPTAVTEPGAPVVRPPAPLH